MVVKLANHSCPRWHLHVSGARPWEYVVESKLPPLDSAMAAILSMEFRLLLAF
jgi:hypothetical protein